MSLINRVKKLWDNGITKKYFLLIVLLIIVLLFLLLDIGIPHAGTRYRVYDMHYILGTLIFFLLLWIFAGNILGLILALYADLEYLFETFPMFDSHFCTLIVCFYLFCSMLRCRNMKVNVFMALVPFYNPIALLFKKTQNRENETQPVV